MSTAEVTETKKRARDIKSEEDLDLADDKVCVYTCVPKSLEDTHCTNSPPTS